MKMENEIMKCESGPSYNADIYIAGNINTIEEVCRDWVARGACVTITPTSFVYTGGLETGARISFINYQRFPKPPHAITTQAFDLAKDLIQACAQRSASIVTSDMTYYLHNGED